jgi:hypothetical protein
MILPSMGKIQGSWFMRLLGLGAMSHPQVGTSDLPESVRGGLTLVGIEGAAWSWLPYHCDPLRCLFLWEQKPRPSRVCITDTWL